MTYFIDPYKKYYDVLSGAGDLSGSATSMFSIITEADTVVTNVKSAISSSTWTEQGMIELSQTVLPNLSSAMATLKNNTSKLSSIAGKASELLGEVSKLKSEDDLYDKYNDELNSLPTESATTSDGKANPNYDAYVSKKADLEKKIEESRKKCEEYIMKSNSIANDIRSTDSSMEDVKVAVQKAAGSAKKADTSTIIESVQGGKMLKVKVDGKEYYICNSKINALDYEQYVQKEGLTQNDGVCRGDCMLLSQYYAVDMMRGSWTSKDTMVNAQGAPAPRINDYVKSENRESILKYIYEEALAGRPTVLQVTQVNSSMGDRHLVTVVGFDTSVKSYQDLNADTILVLDCFDGKIQTLSKSRAEGGHERDLFAQGGLYFARGATSEFLAKEVQTVRNSA